MNREDYCKGLEALAAWLREHPELPLPREGQGGGPACGDHVSLHTSTPEGFDLFIAALPGEVTHDHATGPGGLRYVAGCVGGLSLEMFGRPAKQLTLYHRTSLADAVHATTGKRLQSVDGWLCASNKLNGVRAEASGPEPGVVVLRVPEHLAELVDEWPGEERWYKLRVDSLQPEHFVVDGQA